MQDSLPIRREMLRAFMRTPLARCGRCDGFGVGAVVVGLLGLGWWLRGS
jgi:hypothetical protein